MRNGACIVLFFVFALVFALVFSLVFDSASASASVSPSVFAFVFALVFTALPAFGGGKCEPLNSETCPVLRDFTVFDSTKPLHFNHPCSSLDNNNFHYWTAYAFFELDDSASKNAKALVLAKVYVGWLAGENAMDQIGDQTRVQTENQTENQTRHQTMDQIGDQTVAQTRDQTGNQTGHQTEDQTENQTGHQTMDQTGENTAKRKNTGDTIGKGKRGVSGVETIGEVNTAVGNAIGRGIRLSIEKIKLKADAWGGDSISLLFYLSNAKTGEMIESGPSSSYLHYSRGLRFDHKNYVLTDQGELNWESTLEAKEFLALGEEVEKGANSYQWESKDSEGLFIERADILKPDGDGDTYRLYLLLRQERTKESLSLKGPILSQLESLLEAGFSGARRLSFWDVINPFDIKEGGLWDLIGDVWKYGDCDVWPRRWAKKEFQHRWLKDF